MNSYESLALKPNVLQGLKQPPYKARNQKTDRLYADYALALTSSKYIGKDIFTAGREHKSGKHGIYFLI